MIGKLAPKQYQGIMMGSWMLWTGLASLFAGDFSGMIPSPTGATAAETNPGYIETLHQARPYHSRRRRWIARANPVFAQADHRQS